MLLLLLLEDDDAPAELLLLSTVEDGAADKLDELDAPVELLLLLLLSAVEDGTADELDDELDAEDESEAPVELELDGEVETGAGDTSGNEPLLAMYAKSAGVSASGDVTRLRIKAIAPKPPSLAEPSQKPGTRLVKEGPK